MLFEKKIVLDSRLEELARRIGKVKCFADIGTDHGRLGVYCLQNKQCERVILTDISEKSLDKARKLVRLTGFDAQTTFCVGDGASALNAKVDVAVIAGMGGDTIAGIVENAQGNLRGARIIMQPNVAAPELRRRLNLAHWLIVDETLVRDGRRLYVIIEACEGEQRLTDIEYEVGPILLKRKPPLLNDFAQFRLRVAKKAIAGAQGGHDECQVALLNREIQIWDEVSACL